MEHYLVASIHASIDDKLAESFNTKPHENSRLMSKATLNDSERSILDGAEEALPFLEEEKVKRWLKMPDWAVG